MEFYKLFFLSSVDLPFGFYDTFKVVSQLEFPLYTEVLIKRPHNFSKDLLLLRLSSLFYPLPFLVVNVYRLNSNPLIYSPFQLNCLYFYLNVFLKN